MNSKQVRTLQLDDCVFVLPSEMTVKDIKDLSGFLLMLPRVQYRYGADWKSFAYTAPDTQVKLGMLELYDTKEAAEAAALASKAAKEAEEAQARAD